MGNGTIYSINTSVFFSFLLVSVERYMKSEEKTVPALLDYLQNLDPEGERGSGARHTGENVTCRV